MTGAGWGEARPCGVPAGWGPRGPGEVIVIDHRDSFVFNLVEGLRTIVAERVSVVRADRCDPQWIKALRPRAIVLSPGPGRPERASASIAIARELGRRTPILGVCLGHQVIALAYGGQIVASGAPLHGVARAVEHDGTGLFDGIGPGALFGRYHALVSAEPLAPALEVRARSGPWVMALRHRARPVWGVQFHPESVLSPEGARLMRNFAALAGCALIGEGVAQSAPARGPARGGA